MKTNQTKKTDIFLIDPRNIVVMENFNVRRDFDLDELKEQIKAKGVLNPLTVVPFKEDGVEKYKLVDGERRYRAVMLAIEEGVDIPFVKALKAPRNASMEALYVEQMMRNEGKKFTEYECGLMFKRFKDEYGYNQTEIADKFSKSPAFVSKCLSMMELPEGILKRIEENHISAKAARDIASIYEDDAEKLAAVEKTVKEAHDQGKKTATNKDVNFALRDAKEAKAIGEALMKIWAYTDGDDNINILSVVELLNKTGNLRQAMKQYKNQNK
ncbi:MAG TPA: chromosome partitioning protein ParB [Porphyromonadaceae bacterium]|nr:chromosome partitioning protein ParB [Porphyromonadaceae bacterium]